MLSWSGRIALIAYVVILIPDQLQWIGRLLGVDVGRAALMNYLNLVSGWVYLALIVLLSMRMRELSRRSWRNRLGQTCIWMAVGTVATHVAWEINVHHPAMSMLRWYLFMGGLVAVGIWQMAMFWFVRRCVTRAITCAR